MDTFDDGSLMKWQDESPTSSSTSSKEAEKSSAIQRLDPKPWMKVNRRIERSPTGAVNPVESTEWTGRCLEGFIALLESVIQIPPAALLGSIGSIAVVNQGAIPGTTRELSRHQS